MLFHSTDPKRFLHLSLFLVRVESVGLLARFPLFFALFDCILQLLFFFSSSLALFLLALGFSCASSLSFNSAPLGLFFCFSLFLCLFALLAPLKLDRLNRHLLDQAVVLA